jgi:hypothetical protein
LPFNEILKPEMMKLDNNFCKICFELVLKSGKHAQIPYNLIRTIYLFAIGKNQVLPEGKQ